jgi:hypothetical protein
MAVTQWLGKSTSTPPRIYFPGTLTLSPRVLSSTPLETTDLFLRRFSES